MSVLLFNLSAQLDLFTSIFSFSKRIRQLGPEGMGDVVSATCLLFVFLETAVPGPFSAICQPRTPALSRTPNLHKHDRPFGHLEAWEFI